jgi:hypothetical protein
MGRPFDPMVSTMTADNPKQWRVDNARHLEGARLAFRRYTRRSESWDHDHCTACWARFAAFDAPGVQQEGYATTGDYKFGAGYDWVCRECFEDLHADLRWTVVRCA